MINIRSEAHTDQIKFTMLNILRMLQCFNLLMHRMQNAGRYFNINFNWKIHILYIKTVNKPCSHIIRHSINVMLFFCHSMQRVSSIRFHFLAFFSFPRQYYQQKWKKVRRNFIISSTSAFEVQVECLPSIPEWWYRCQCNRMNERWAHLVNDKIPYRNDFWGIISLTSHHQSNEN